MPVAGVTPKPVWLWWSGTDATNADTDRLWQSYLRRFDIEHTFRLFKQTLGWTAPKIRTPEAADRWAWLIIAQWARLEPLLPTGIKPGRPQVWTRRQRVCPGFEGVGLLEDELSSSPRRPSCPAAIRPSSAAGSST
ncbi:hypothetical protein GCM10010129_56580 [Streptomyces fumigatiscleroticus]|nr:hypothetical protein GCM10010129_56580 [Streptomyces fumigatiscleroticus]